MYIYLPVPPQTPEVPTTVKVCRHQSLYYNMLRLTETIF